jgi:hypothetical protein
MVYNLKYVFVEFKTTVIDSPKIKVFLMTSLVFRHSNFLHLFECLNSEVFKCKPFFTI